MANTHTDLDWLDSDFFNKHHLEEKMSFPAISKMLADRDIIVHQSTLHRRARKLGIGRNTSEAKRNRDPNPLDYTVSFLDESIIEHIDGFLLGDGGLNANTSSIVGTARACCNLEHKEFAKYMMMGFSKYQGVVREIVSESMKYGIVYAGLTKFHPDLRVHYDRWYVEVNGLIKKCVPTDVRLTPHSVMLWYLGDGSLVESGENSIALRLSTDGFLPSCVDVLVAKLNGIGIAAHRNNDNRIWVEAKGIPAFFDFIGRKSPVKCYNYKFDLPEWRFEAKRMSEVADELKLDYHRLAHLVKMGTIPCYRASDKGRPRFLPEHIEAVKKAMKAGILY